MKKTKRILAFAIVFALVAGLMPAVFAASFSDVPAGAWYAEPVSWAVENNITSGVGGGLFAPGNTCTRGQVVTFLWRSQGEPAPKSNENPFTDVKEGQYYYDAVLWAVEKGITTGLSATSFGPSSPCTRGQVVTFLWRALGKPAPKSMENPFDDVSYGQYYFDAVLWAVEQGITTGLDATTFGPGSPCTRGHVVTFLYRSPDAEEDPNPNPDTDPDPGPSPDPGPNPDPGPRPDPGPSPDPEPEELSIAVQPKAQTVEYGETALLTVKASGGVEPYSYQWMVDGAAISGAVDAEYEAAESGSYSCVITDAEGSKIKSASAAVTVNPPADNSLHITKNPVGGEITGSYIRLTVEVSGGEKPYVYEWYKDGAPLDNAKFSYYMANEPGVYSCIITDALGESVFSDDAIVTLPNVDYAISYNVTGNDSYLKGLTIENPNPETYPSSVGLKLKNLEVEGYVFDGWYDGPGANADVVKEIPAGSEGEMQLYARWSPIEYTINFHNPLQDTDPKTYTVNKGTTLTNPEWYRYIFIGWSDEQGNLVTEIPKGTTGDMTLYANWTSMRNQTVPVSSLGDPIIVEEDGQILFAYHIGRIENVPLAVIENFQWQSSGGITWEKEVSREVTIGEENATTIGETVSQATTNSAAWTLSQETSQNYQISDSTTQEASAEVTKSAEAQLANTGKFSLGYETGGSKTTTTEWGVSGKVGFGYSSKKKADASIMGVGMEGEKGWNVNGEIGGHYDKTESNTKTWNASTGYEAGYEASISNSISASLSKSISKTHGFTQDYGSSEEWSQSNETATTDTQEREYSSTVVYRTDKTETTTMKLTNANAKDGYYRIVSAGTVQVFAVVGYDIATRSFYTYTYSVVDETRGQEEFLDYSATTSGFDDYENGVLPFEVPIFVENYVNSKTLASEGLTVNTSTGKITAYNGEADYVIVPQYKSVDNGDGTFTVVQITGIEAGVFADKENIIEVKLPDTVTEIPANAFAGCTNLKKVYVGQLTRIGANAFAGCSALESFTVPSSVDYLGTGAFKDASQVIINAGNAAVAKAAFGCGAKRITVNMADMADSLEDYEVVIPEGTEYFDFQGGLKNFVGVKINSSADETVINGATFSGVKGTPLEINSEKLTLNRVTVDAAGLGMQLFAENTDVALYGEVSMTTQGSNVVLTNDVKFHEQDANNDSKMVLAGNMLVCGSIEGEDFLKFTNMSLYKVIICDSGSFFVSFNPNGGSVEETDRIVACAQPIGTLPVPQKDYHDFDGWFTAPEGGEEVTESSTWPYAMDMVLYAHWREKGVSEWVKADELPAGAEIVGEKWSYTETTVTESAETALPGYTATGNKRWVETGSGSQEYASFPGGFSKSHSIYVNMAKSVPYSAYETETAKRVVNNSWTGFVYWHWMYSVSYANRTDRAISPNSGYWDTSGNSGKGANYKYFFAMKSAVDCPYLDKFYCCSQSMAGYNCHSILPADKTNIGTPRCFRFDYYTSYYTDYQMYFEYKKVESKESTTEIAAGGNISDVQKWVQYREK